MSLSTIIKGPPSPHQPFLLLQSSTAQSSIPIIRQILSRNLRPDNIKHSRHFLLFCLLHPPSNLLENTEISAENLEVHDWIDNVPGYTANWFDPLERILSAVKNGEHSCKSLKWLAIKPGAASSRPLYVVVDSVDTLLLDTGTIARTYAFFSELLALIRARTSEYNYNLFKPMLTINTGPSHLLLHAVRPSKLLPLLTQSSFSSSLTYVIAHPPVLLTHLAKDYLTSPPPSSPEAKFWGAFLPLSERGHDIDRLVFGTDGEGSGEAAEIVVEVLVRGGDGSGRKRTVERVLDAWSLQEGGACDLVKLESLKGVWTKKAIEEVRYPDILSSISSHPVSLSRLLQQILPTMRHSTLALHFHNKNRALKCPFRMLTKVGCALLRFDIFSYAFY